MREFDVFISYKRDEFELAYAVSRRLKDAGYVAVTDLNLQRATDFGEAIDQAIKVSKLVLVLWTEASLRSSWVKKEAAEAERLGKYLGVVFSGVAKPDDLPFTVRDSNFLDVSFGNHERNLERIVANVQFVIGAATRSSYNANLETDTAEKDLEFYQAVHLIGEKTGYQKYLERYPNGTYREVAEQHIKRLSAWYKPILQFPALTFFTCTAASLQALAVLWEPSASDIGLGIAAEEISATKQRDTITVAELAALQEKTKQLQMQLANQESLESQLNEKIAELQNELIVANAVGIGIGASSKNEDLLSQELREEWVAKFHQTLTNCLQSNLEFSPAGQNTFVFAFDLTRQAEIVPESVSIISSPPWVKEKINRVFSLIKSDIDTCDFSKAELPESEYHNWQSVEMTFRLQ